MLEETNNIKICECCKKKVEKVIPRYVPVKKKVLSICSDCMAVHVTYDPSLYIPDGDASLTC